MSKLVFTDEPTLDVLVQVATAVIVEKQGPTNVAGDPFEVLAAKVEDKVVTVPTGTTGWETQPDGTLWVEYTP
jgi:hypothetical protein